MLVYGQMQAQIKKQHSQTTILRRDLQALIKEVITQPLNYHVTLSWSQWLIINTKNKSLGGFLHSDATRTLKNAWRNNVEIWKMKLLPLIIAHV